MDLLNSILQNPAGLFVFCVFGLPIIATSVWSLATAYMKHRERMAMIAAGMHPDSVAKADEAEEEEMEASV